MTQFPSQKQAKEYLAGRIIAEAEREGVQLSDVERKMLYFSETDWAPPGILDVAAEFDRDYDDNEYERKIAELVGNSLANATQEQGERWREAVMKLSEGDHYLLVLIARAAPARQTGGIMRTLDPWLPQIDGRQKRPAHDLARLLLVGLGFAVLVIVAVAIGAMFH